MSAEQTAAPAPAKAAVGGTGFPTELKRHMFTGVDMRLVSIGSISLVLHLLMVMLVAGHEWKDPTADWTAEDLMKAQAVVMTTLDPTAVEELEAELEELFSDVLNEGFFEELAEQQVQQAQEVAQLLNEAAAMAEEMADLGNLADLGGEDLAASLGDLSDLGSMDFGADIGADAGLELGAADVQIFAQVEGGAVRGRAIGSGVDIAALGSNVQISSSFQKGGMSADQAARLSQQISVARSKLGADFQINVNPGLTGTARARMRAVGQGGGSTGKAIALESLALPPSKPKTAGGRSLTDVERRAAQSGQMVSACYLAGLADNPSLAGVIVVRFTINANGSVSNVSIADSNLGSPVVEDCLQATVSSWSFPTGPSSETFDYPFTFEPG
ncbi:MAG: AgmX/PglI C-terminal domain-containing protein [Candidatus Latescibacteria bacterium]|nr:AgmX/PglI C-terminal domain-containing protein [Candidatus Latescibacterota bacterium]